MKYRALSAVKIGNTTYNKGVILTEEEYEDLKPEDKFLVVTHPIYLSREQRMTIIKECKIRLNNMVQTLKFAPAGSVSFELRNILRSIIHTKHYVQLENDDPFKLLNLPILAVGKKFWWHPNDYQSRINYINDALDDLPF